MITLALDEFGDFEGIKKDNKPIGIAGILYDDANDKADLINERKRVEAFYKACINSVIERIGSNRELVYPDALHSNNSKERDSVIVKPVKRKINDAIKEFLRTGTFEGRELLKGNNGRKGKYYVFAIIKSDRGMTSLLGENANFLVNDEKGSNLYFHMASEVVNRMMFHNPIIRNIREVSMNIATRRSDDMDSNSVEAQEYRRQGYSAQKSNKAGLEGMVYFGIANGDIYRSILSQEIIRAGKTQLKIDDFMVRPIRYAANAKDMEFLYLADSVCTYLSNGIEGNTDADKLIKIVNKTNQINYKEQNIIFGYDEIDLLYQKAWNLYELGEYYDCLEICYDAQLLKEGYSEYYKKWFEHIRNLISLDDDEGRFVRAVHRVHSTINTNKLDQDKSIYIIDTLEKMIPNVSVNLDDAESQAIIYTLYDAAVSLYCHIGNSKKAIGYYNKCKKYATRVGVEEYLITMNKLSEILLDNFEWKKAKQIADDSVKYQIELIKMKNTLPIYGIDEEDKSLGLGKAYSQSGQVYAFMKDDRAVEYFKLALENFDNNSADYRITQSYLLHFYLDNNMKEEYLLESKKYFGNETSLSKQLSYILKEGFQESPIFNYKYALYVFVRGIYCFRIDEMSDELKDKLYDINATIKKGEEKVKGKRNSSFIKLTGHPSELIYKYISMITYLKNDIEKANELAICIRDCLGYTGETIELINLNSEAELALLKGDSMYEEKLFEIYNYMINSFEVFKKENTDKDIDEVKTFIESNLTFMYK